MQNSDTRSTCFSFDADRLAESAGRCRPTSPPGPSRVSPNSVAHPGAASPAAGRHKALQNGGVLQPSVGRPAVSQV